MGITMNDYVRVRLNDRGREVLRKKQQELRASLRRPEALPGDGVPDEDKDGWSRWQLWCLLSAFGNDSGAGAAVVFDEFEIEAQ